ncbi:Mu-like prophage FluMu protein gp28 [Hahella chejuensis KCTC 2396]|uniref:Mu-like prophage FluMu protein gp28 n=1 Tax=Hahella chejuensis (strain KCTC 2396) TaxID=349521 RepID=Q2SPW7_HAHCH|nr:terminase family protein [Hahella chejuensis]ABC27307.1 Mu-like prophage FluMu protein gp28 [Hahella chejuensis KCTC 2396]
MSSRYPPEIIEAAKGLFLRHITPAEIQQQLGINNVRVIYQWIERHNWKDMLQHETVEQATARRLIHLVEKTNKVAVDYQEIDRLSNLLDKLAGIDLKKAKTAREKAQSEHGDAGGNRKKKKRGVKNDVSGITPERLETIRKELFYDYQHRWHDNKSQRTRFILKSRQIGATYYFAWEAFQDAITSGDNQIFLSASRSQADIFKAYILKFAREYFDTELKGVDVIPLSNGAELRFVSTNGRTAQGYHGHLYIDEVFWIPDFDRLNKLASGMAAHKKWRKTYFSTPSVKSHGAYTLWSGERYNESRRHKVEFDLSRAALREGQLGPDKVWRNVVTVEDAANQGCDLFDIDELKQEYTEAEFNNLFMCAFMEAGLSVFKLDDLLSCAVCSSDVWPDFKPRQPRPFANYPVWLGYDPARTGDRSTVVVVAPPMHPAGKFRVLEKIQLKGAFSYQANRIKDLLGRYNVQFVGIDCTGPGLGVFEQVKAFYPRATPIHYSLNAKTALVLKAMDVIENARIEWDAEHTDIPQAFLQVKQTTTGNDLVTYVADRSSKTGHADVAWSIMHALSNEPLDRKQRRGSIAMAG